MEIKFSMSCMGHQVGENTVFSIQLNDEDIANLTEVEKEAYLHECVQAHILERLDFGIIK